MFRLQSFIAEADTGPIDVSEHKPVVVAPGRFNPPTVGHKRMLKRLVELGQELNAKPVVIVVDSGKYDARNPLPGDVRKEYLSKMFPGVEIMVAKNPYDAIWDMYETRQEYPIGGVTGADRAEAYKEMIRRMLGAKVADQYKAEILHRHPDVEGIAGVSGSKAREAAVREDEGAFVAMTGLEHDDAIRLMALIRKGMGAE